MMGLLADIKSLLTGVDYIYLGSMPDQPDDAVSIYSSGGYPRSLSGTMVEEPTFMVKVRNRSYAAGEEICTVIKDKLHGVNYESVNGHDILLIAQQGDVNSLGRDENGRHEWSVNFRMYYRR